MKIVLISTLLLALGLMASSVHAEDQARGKVVYDKFCSHCHNPGNWAAFKLTQRNGEKLALIEQRTDMPAALVMTAIRNGIGNMPPYRLTDISNADAQAVADYLTRKR
jgi:mono/diheme cytochrome c family protein